MGRRGTVAVEAITPNRVMTDPLDPGPRGSCRSLIPVKHLEEPYRIIHSGFATLRFSILCVLAHRIPSQEIGSKDAPREERRYEIHGLILMKTAVPASLVA